jgi:hypothetical protein
MATVDETFSFIKTEIAQAQKQHIIKTMSPDLLCEIAIAQMSAVIQHTFQNNVPEQDQANLIQQSFEIYWDGIKAN